MKLRCIRRLLYNYFSALSAAQAPPRGDLSCAQISMLRALHSELLAYPAREMRSKDVAAHGVGCLLHAPPGRKVRIVEITLRLSGGRLRSLPVVASSRFAHRLQSDVVQPAL